MLSGKELFHHSIFSGLATLAVLGGLYSSVKTSWASEVHVDSHLILKKSLTSFVATIFFALFIYCLQKADLRIGYVISLVIIYIPTIIFSGWALDVYVRGVLMVH